MAQLQGRGGAVSSRASASEVRGTGGQTRGSWKAGGRLCRTWETVFMCKVIKTIKHNGKCVESRSLNPNMQQPVYAHRCKSLRKQSTSRGWCVWLQSPVI